ncbi:MAG: hypothetical protein AB1414_01220 [bacterium]
MKTEDYQIKDFFKDYLEYLRKKGLTEKTITEHGRFIYGAISHAELSDEQEMKFEKNS